MHELIFCVSFDPCLCLTITGENGAVNHGGDIDELLLQSLRARTSYAIIVAYKGPRPPFYHLRSELLGRAATVKVDNLSHKTVSCSRRVGHIGHRAVFVAAEFIGGSVSQPTEKLPLAAQLKQEHCRGARTEEMKPPVAPIPEKTFRRALCICEVTES